MATQIRKGQSITLSTSEVAYELAGDTSLITDVLIVLVSGTLQVTAQPGRSETPVLNSTYTTYSTAGDKIIVSMQPGSSTLRMKCASAGVVSVTW
jgi:hypothetical protein